MGQKALYRPFLFANMFVRGSLGFVRLAHLFRGMEAYMDSLTLFFDNYLRFDGAIDVLLVFVSLSFVPSSQCV